MHMAKKIDEKLPGANSNTQTQVAITPYRAPEQQRDPNEKIIDGAKQAANQPSYKPYDGLPGVSNTTASHMGQYQQGYTASAAVQQAQQYLDNLLNNKPGEFASNYTQQLNDIYGQIMNRDPFQYNLNEDMLYQQAKDQYMLTGQQAMMDTMAMASAMSGGYGSSYASTAGNQAYQQHLTALNNMVPELYDRAFSRYQAEGEDLYNKYNLTMQADERDFSRYTAALDQWNNDRAFGLDQYSTLYNQDYGQYSDALNYWTNLATTENSNYWNERDQAYKTAAAMLEQGKMPSADLLAAAGISPADARKWRKKDTKQKSSNPSSNNSNNNKPATDTSQNPPQVYNPTLPMIFPTLFDPDKYTR